MLAITVAAVAIAAAGRRFDGIYLRRCVCGIAGYRVQRVITIVDREEGGVAAMKSAGLELISLYRLSEVAGCALELTA